MNFMVAHQRAISGQGDMTGPKRFRVKPRFSTASKSAASQRPHARKRPEEAKGHPLDRITSEAQIQARLMVEA